MKSGDSINGATAVDGHSGLHGASLAAAGTAVKSGDSINGATAVDGHSGLHGASLAAAGTAMKSGDSINGATAVAAGHPVAADGSGLLAVPRLDGRLPLPTAEPVVTVAAVGSGTEHLEERTGAADRVSPPDAALAGAAYGPHRHDRLAAE